MVQCVEGIHAKLQVNPLRQFNVLPHAKGQVSRPRDPDVSENGRIIGRPCGEVLIDAVLGGVGRRGWLPVITRQVLNSRPTRVLRRIVQIRV